MSSDMRSVPDLKIKRDYQLTKSGSGLNGKLETDTTRDVPDSNFPNLAGAGPGRICQKRPDA